MPRSTPIPKEKFEFESHQDGAQAVVTVADNGIGISADLLPRVFDLFVQSDRTLDQAQQPQKHPNVAVELVRIPQSV